MKFHFHTCSQRLGRFMNDGGLYDELRDFVTRYFYNIGSLQNIKFPSFNKTYINFLK